MGLFFGPSTQIGVSIGTSSVKIAELKKSGKSFSLVHFGVAQLPDEALANREIVNHMAVVDAIRSLVDQLKIKGRGVITSVAGPSVIVKKILLEQTPPKELDDAILWEVEQYVPFDINEVVFDYQVLNKNGSEGKMEIMLVASKRAAVESFQSALKDAGLTTQIIDIDALAIQNAFEVNYPGQGCVTIVDIGASSLKVVVVANGMSVFSRDASVGGRVLTQEIQRHLNLSYQEAEILKIDGNAQGQVPQEVADLMQVMSENIASEIKRSVDFYIASNSGPPTSKIFLCGGSSRLPNLQRIVETVVGLPTEMFNPFQAIQYDNKTFTQDYIEAISGMAVVPIGLALRGFLK